MDFKLFKNRYWIKEVCNKDNSEHHSNWES